MHKAALLVPLAVALATCAAAGLSGVGCGYAKEPDVDAAVVSDTDGATDDSKVQGIEVHDDVAPQMKACGEDFLCDPDVPAICTVLVTDAGEGGTDAAATDAAEAGITACRVVRDDNKITSECAPAGKMVESSIDTCSNDADCAPGLACVGPVGEGRCLRYCCGAYKDPVLAADAGAGKSYCTLRPLASDPTIKVPVWVKLDNCTLLDDSLQCADGSTCTVVTNDGRTTCVPVGTGRDWAPCDDEPCDRGYVCLGSVDRRCRKLCKEAEGATACAGGAYCQRTPTIPMGYGICSGGDAG